MMIYVVLKNDYYYVPFRNSISLTGETSEWCKDNWMVDAVFSTLELAEKYIAKQPLTKQNDYHISMKILDVEALPESNASDLSG